MHKNNRLNIEKQSIRIILCIFLYTTLIMVMGGIGFRWNAMALNSDKETCVSTSETGTTGAASTSVTDWVCEKCYANESARYGAAWFNDVDNNTANKQTITINIKTNDEDLKNGKNEVIAYVHGQFYACSSSYDPTSDTNMNADHVRIVKPVGSTYSWTVGASHPSSLGFISGLSDSTLLNRGGDANVSKESWSKSGTPISMIIDIDKLQDYVDNDNYKISNSTTTNDNGKYICSKSGNKVKCKVGIYRCPKGLEADDKIKKGCGSDDEEMNFENYAIVSGKIKIKVKNKNVVSGDDNGEDEGEDGDDEEDCSGERIEVLATSFTGTKTQKCTATNPPYTTKAYSDGTTSMGHLMNIPQTTYTVEIQDGKKQNFHLNAKLKSTSKVDNIEYYFVNSSFGSDSKHTMIGSASTTKTWATEKGNKSLPAYTDKTNSNGDLRKYYSVTAYANDGKITFKTEDGDEVQLANNTFCRTILYNTNRGSITGSNGEYEARQTCIKVTTPEVEAKPKIEGRIRVNAAVKPTLASGSTSVNASTAAASALLTASGTVNTKFANKNKPTREVGTTTLNDGESTSIYAQWAFDIKSDMANGQYRYRRVRCLSRDNTCESWIKKVDPKNYEGLPKSSDSDDMHRARVNVDSGDYIDGTWVTRGSDDKLELSALNTNSVSVTDTNGAVHEYIEDEEHAHEYVDKLKADGEYTVCYAWMVAENSESPTKVQNGNTVANSAWNNSYACIHAKADTVLPDNPLGRTTLTYKVDKYDGTGEGKCSIQYSNQDSATDNIKIRRNATTSDPDNYTPTMASISCDEEVSSVYVTFGHKAWSDDSLNKQHTYTIKHNYSPSRSPDLKFEDSRATTTKTVTLPTNIPGKIIDADGGDGVIIRSNNDGGKYELTKDNTICEGLFVDNKQSIVCVSLTSADVPNPSLLGSSSVKSLSSTDSTCSVGETISQRTTSSNRVGGSTLDGTLEVECNSAVVFEFEHSMSGSNLAHDTRHRIFHRDYIAETSGKTAHDTNHSRGSNVSETLYTKVSGSGYTVNGNGQYTIQPNGKVCESQWFGTEGDENDPAMVSKVCATVKPGGIIGACPGEPGQADTKESGKSYITSYVKNLSNSNFGGDKLTSILAKPTDQIEFNHCYYTGAQSVRTTKYWDVLNTNESEPDTPQTKSYCNKEYKQGETAPTACDSAPTYTLTGGTGCSAGDWTHCDGGSYSGYTVDTAEKETLVEANYSGNKVESNETYNTYYISSSYPGAHGLGNGLSETSSSSITDEDYSSDSIGMKYSGDGFNSTTTGTAGKVAAGIAKNNSNIFVTVGSPGGELTQSITAYTGTVVRKEHAEEWDWDIGYQFTPCMFKKKPNTNPQEYESTCTKQSKKSVSSSSTSHGSGVGHHGSAYYERDKETDVTEAVTDYDYETKTSKVYIPYNYQNTALIELDDSVKIFAGESFKLKNAYVYVNPIENDQTAPGGQKYATIAPNINVELYAYISTDGDQNRETRTSDGNTLNGCSYYSGSTGLPCETIDWAYGKDFNVLGKMGGTKNEYREKAFKAASYNAFDYFAGAYLCVGLGMNRSKTHTFYVGNTEGSEVEEGSIYYSNASCAKIYKKPTFAVWGGSVFSNGTISTSTLDKRNVANYVPYQRTGTNFRITFSSWVEGIIVGNGQIKGLSSGAATGYTFPGDSGNDYAPIAAPGGIDSGDYCVMSAITVANESCSGKTSGNANLGNRTGVKEEIIRRYYTDYIDMNNNTLIQGDCGGRCTTKIWDGSNYPLNVEYGTTTVYFSTGTITIDHDIKYPDHYATASHVSQIIIYAKGDINISGNVTNIDAILISDGKINTCASGTCHQRLRINGVLIGNVIELNRLYGASVGSYSVEPAEIVNFSPTTYLWGSIEASGDLSEDLVEVYTRELAPRQ